MSAAFEIRDAVHLVRPLPGVATDLASLAEGIARASRGTLFYHVHHPRLRHAGASTSPPDDFTAWIETILQDATTAERLAYAVQAHGGEPAALRDALLTALGAAPPGRSTTAPEASTFVFHDVDVIALDLERRVDDADALVNALCDGHVSAFFHHVVEAPWFGDEAASAAAWARERGETRLAGWLEECAHDGLPLAESRLRLGRRWRRSGVVRRVARGLERTSGAREDDARRAVSDLVQRIRRG